jgi:NAD(P)-dependent dehydrogenase (short-subunit alcohol dehydrogenase family)
MPLTAKKVWLITGAGRGLGVDIAKAALAAGHEVVATGRDAAKVAAALGDHDNLLVITRTSPAYRMRRQQSRPLSRSSAESTFW